MADDLMRLSEYPEASDEQMTNDALMEVSVVDQEAASGFESRKSPLSRLANYILNKYSSLNLGGSQRTVKSAIDAIGPAVAELVTSLGNLKFITVSEPVTTGTIYDRIEAAYNNGKYPIGIPFIGLQTSGQIFLIIGHIYTSDSSNYGGVIALSYSGLTYSRIYNNTITSTYLDRTEKFTVTSAGSYYTIARQNCYKSGSRVFISVELNVAVANPPTAADIVTVPEKYRPLSSLNGLGFVCRENANGVRNFRPALVYVGSSGGVRQSLSSAMAIGDIVTLWAEYIIE